MYNRYIRNDQGVYSRIPEQEPRQQAKGPEKEKQAQAPPPPPPPEPHQPKPPPPKVGRPLDGLTGFLRHILDQWHLDSVDTGDLLLLGLLFFLFREDADDELLSALGLLLIL